MNVMPDLFRIPTFLHRFRDRGTLSAMTKYFEMASKESVSDTICHPTEIIFAIPPNLTIFATKFQLCVKPGFYFG
ncbi:MAG: hypothetical protein UZ12_BCD005001625 [Bacteroidetes bacterium OLB12]|nr:MAG: hypothetical protein UZ12_BCD005001625 [Bacteroidetes bacterium OLB12]